jgi:hypothetical protein
VRIIPMWKFLSKLSNPVNKLRSPAMRNLSILLAVISWREARRAMCAHERGNFQACSRRTAVGGVGVHQVAVQGELAGEDRPRCVRSMNFDHRRRGCSARTRMDRLAPIAHRNAPNLAGRVKREIQSAVQVGKATDDNSSTLLFAPLL